jgi:DNA repair protein RecN (Recombination protein N)
VLNELRVEDLGVIDGVDIVLGSGMTAITGETGAGKTLLVEAIELLVGGRADSSVVRAGAGEARVEGRFVIGDAETVLARVVPSDGRSRAYVDGRMAQVGALAEAGAALVDLHGQHSHQSLLAPGVQRAALDAFAGEPAVAALTDYRAARQQVAALTRELDALGGDSRLRAREIDLLRFQRDEIDAAAIAGAGEEEQLEGEELVLADATAHREAAARAQEAVSDGALDAVGSAMNALADRVPFADVEQRLRAVHAELSEIARDVRVAGDSIVDDAERLEAVRARRQLLRGLCRKYGDTIADVLAYREEIGVRLGALEGYEEKAAALENAIATAGADADRAARRLSKARRAAAGALGDAVTMHVRELAMPHASFAVEVEPADPGADGADAVRFLLAANPGEPALPLAKVASGGELARTMLAARVVLSGAPPTLVFDEVDAGIGGEAGTAVGRKLAAIAGDHQVLCVTHLPQVAAFADHHVVVSKREVKGRTVAEARVVEGDERIAEISRMLAGVGDSATAREHARELLARASAEFAR